MEDKVPSSVKENVEAKVKAVREALAGSDVATIKARTDELASALHQVGASVYEQPGSGPGSSGEHTGDQGPSDKAHLVKMW